ncbi:MAG TPA: VOC family protein [Candidatus Nanoarchaeia archaeon]|nr:VOC family protein [Candidatus Nanoarchaeia archaeon]
MTKQKIVPHLRFDKEAVEAAEFYTSIFTDSKITQSKKQKCMKAKNISISINASSDKVYLFASNPKNLPKWASGLGKGIKKVNSSWIINSPMGKIQIRFAEINKYGILDHDVTLESGEKFHNPMRVIPNDKGSEVIFTLFRQPGMSEKKFLEDERMIRKDLRTLKRLMEAKK